MRRVSSSTPSSSSSRLLSLTAVGSSMMNSSAPTSTTLHHNHINAPVSYHSFRTFYSGLDPEKHRRLKLSSHIYNRPRGRDQQTEQFEQSIELVQSEGPNSIFERCWSTDAEAEADNKNIVCVEAITMKDLEENFIPHPSANSLYTDLAKTEYDFGTRRNLRRNADCWPTEFSHKRTLIHIIDPVLNFVHYRREEAQVELITAFRNILFEFHDLVGKSPEGKRREPSMVPPITDTPITLRVPALSVYSIPERFSGDIGKLNQQALLKGFHRSAPFVKDWFHAMRNFKLQLYIPKRFYSEFQDAFLEEPWAIPQSVFDIPRMNLYPGLPMPEGLKEYPGYIGKRLEIEELPTEAKVEKLAEPPRLLSKSRPDPNSWGTPLGRDEPQRGDGGGKAEEKVAGQEEAA